MTTDTSDDSELSDGPPAITTKMPTSSTARLTSFPNELLHAILLHLPVRELYQMRRVSKLFRDYMDENQQALLRSTIAYNRTRIITRLETFTPRSSSLTTLKHCFSCYGFPADPKVCFNAYWGVLVRWRDVSMSLRVHKDELGWFFLVNLRNICWDRYCEIFEGTSRGPMVGTESIVAGLIQAAHRDVECGRELLQCLKSIDSLHSPRHTEKRGVPKYSVTSRKMSQGFGLGGVDIEGTCESLDQLLGIPPIDDLAYCAKSKATWSIAAEADEKGQTSLPLFKQAALLEEIFIW